MAALKAVGESGEIPLDYYKVNVGGSLNLIEVSPLYPLFFGIEGGQMKRN